MCAKFDLLNATFNPVLTQGFGYEYDPIGNRKTTSHLRGLASLRENYTANNLNQYTERIVPGKFSVLGSASEDAYVTVSLTNGTPSPVDRQGKYWHKALDVDNTSAAAYPEIKVVGVYNPQSAGILDVVSEEVGRKFIAKTPEQFAYDDDGNMLSDGRFDYTWDAENRLIAVEESRSGVPAAFMKRLEFAYDYMSRRISKKLYRRQGQDWSSTPYKEIVYIYDGWNMICESIRETKSAGGGGGQGGGGKGKGQGQQGQASGGSVSISTNYYVWGLDLFGTLQGAGGIGGLLAAIQDGQTYFACADGNGNVTDYVNTNGIVVAHQEYDPFGGTIALTGTKKDDFNFWFSTKYTDQETSLVYYGYRYYSPGLGRWLSRDPIKDIGSPGTRQLMNQVMFALYQNAMLQLNLAGDERLSTDGRVYFLVGAMTDINLISAIAQGSPVLSLYLGGAHQYVFCANNTVNFVDPSGLLTWSQVGYFAAGVAAGAIVTAAIVAAAPVAVSALVAAGLSTTVASATVTTGLAIGGGVGLYATGVNTYLNITAGNWNAVAYNAGTVVVGLGYGVAGGGRALAGLSGQPSSVPPSWNPFAGAGMGYNPNYLGGSISRWLGKGPMPSSGGLSATGVGTGIVTIPTWFTFSPPSQLGGTQSSKPTPCP